MLKLMALEFRKHRVIDVLFKGVGLAMLIIITFACLLVFVDLEESVRFNTYADISDMILIFTKSTFLIFSSVLLCRLVINEYKNGTINQLFTYPVSRKKLMAAKLAMVFLFTFITIVMTYVVTGAIVLGINHYTGRIQEVLTGAMVMQYLLNLVINAFWSAGMSLIPLFFGMRHKSVPATIVSSVFITIILSSDFGSFQLSDFAMVSVGFAVIGVGFAYMAIRNIENKDIV